MSGTKLSGYGVGDANLTKLMLTCDAQRKGFSAVSLTNYEDDSLPDIAAGSAIEINGALFYFDGDELISGSPSDGDVYIKVIPSGSTCSAEFTADPGDWNTAKFGFYTDGGNSRVISFHIKKTSSIYVTYDHPPVIPVYEEPKTLVLLSGSPVSSYASDKIIKFSQEDADDLDEYDISSGVFTAKFSGVYQICFSIGVYHALSPIPATMPFFQIRKNTSEIVYEYELRLPYFSMVFILQLNSGDTIDLYYNENSATTMYVSTGSPDFNGSITRIR